MEQHILELFCMGFDERVRRQFIGCAITSDSLLAIKGALDMLLLDYNHHFEEKPSFRVAIHSRKQFCAGFLPQNETAWILAKQMRKLERDLEIENSNVIVKDE